jgi:hypothetical protein
MQTFEGTSGAAINPAAADHFPAAQKKRLLTGQGGARNKS